MTTIKSFTSLEQSKKLAELLPLESADKFYCYGMDIHTKKCGYDTVPTIIDADNQIDICDIPCWSLAALISVLPDSIYDNTDEFSQLEFTKKSVAYIQGTTDGVKIGTLKDNLVDACYEMALKLHKLNLL